ncbi:MAG TPA: DNA repair protein RecO [Candidatus Binatia bacterium]|jgi:DNA repair protein RecO (recombination protein O)|nr:DNA repair protein RecO [Candidatus Binatia bacterium]
MLEERTPAVVLRSRIYGESDKLVTFLTQNWGKVTGIAKGAKRSRRRFVNVLEPFTHVHLRFRPGRADELAFIFGCDVIRSFRRPSRDLQRFALASYVTELLDTMVAGRESGPEMYELLLHSLTVLEEHDVLSPLFLSMFELLLLTHAGYAPHFTGCQQCGLSLAETEIPVIFSPSLGGLLCQNCRTQGGVTLLLSPETLRLLRSFKNVTVDTFLQTTTSPRVYRETRALISSWLARHLPRPLKSQAFLEHTGLLSDSRIDASGEE